MVKKSTSQLFSGNIPGWSAKVLGGRRVRKESFFGPQTAHRVLAGSIRPRGEKPHFRGFSSVFGENGLGGRARRRLTKYLYVFSVRETV